MRHVAPIRPELTAVDGAAVRGDADVDLFEVDALFEEAEQTRLRLIERGLIAVLVPAVVRHILDLIKARERLFAHAERAGRQRGGEDRVLFDRLHPVVEAGDELVVALPICFGLGIFPIDVQPVEIILFHKFDHLVGDILPMLRHKDVDAGMPCSARSVGERGADDPDLVRLVAAAADDLFERV